LLHDCYLQRYFAPGDTNVFKSRIHHRGTAQRSRNRKGRGGGVSESLYGQVVTALLENRTPFASGPNTVIENTAIATMAITTAKA